MSKLLNLLGASLSWIWIRELPKSHGLVDALSPIKKSKILLVNRSLPSLFQLLGDLQKVTASKKW